VRPPQAALPPHRKRFGAAVTAYGVAPPTQNLTPEAGPANNML